MFVADAEGTILLVNREIERLFGYGRDELIGKSVDLLVPERMRATHPGLRAQYASEPTTRAMGAGRDLQGRRRDGSEVAVEIGLNPIRTDDGLLVLGTVVDISSRRQLSHNERLASIGMLAAGVGHEINNPLASLMAIVESLERMILRGETSEAARIEALETVRLAEREISRCRETTNKLVLLAQPYSVAPTWADLNGAVRDTASLLRHEIVRRGIDWREALDPELPSIWVRESGLRGVCLNLMMNAVQAMSGGGELRVRTARADRFVELVVEDTGPGIAPQNLPRIWDPFFTTKPAGQGTGLGLFVTQEIVTRNGGTIRAENVKAGGARFTVRLPIDGTQGRAT
jgi:PAS domain S-box-containing protein